MPSHTTGDIRNVVLVGHGGSGKTTLVDAMLSASGTIKHKVSVPDGSSASDFEKEEKEHGHSIYSSILHCDHLGKRINIIDTPGRPDLIGRPSPPAGGRNRRGGHQCPERHRGGHAPNDGDRPLARSAARNHHQ